MPLLSYKLRIKSRCILYIGMRRHLDSLLNELYPLINANFQQTIQQLIILILQFYKYSSLFFLIFYTIHPIFLTSPNKKNRSSNPKRPYYQSKKLFKSLIIFYINYLLDSSHVLLLLALFINI